MFSFLYVIYYHGVNIQSKINVKEGDDDDDDGRYFCIYSTYPE